MLTDDSFTPSKRFRSSYAEPTLQIAALSIVYEKLQDSQTRTLKRKIEAVKLDMERTAMAKENQLSKLACYNARATSALVKLRRMVARAADRLDRYWDYNDKTLNRLNECFCDAEEMIADVDLTEPVDSDTDES